MKPSYIVIHVDLTSRKIEKESISPELVGQFIGGYGLGVKLYYDHAKVGTHPFSPENPVIIGAGMLAGTPVPGAGKIFALTKCPLPGGTAGKFFVGYGSGGSPQFGRNLKRAGYDSLVITGQSSSPCYILIEDDLVQICDATDLWGAKDIDETTDILTDKHKGAGVIAIGKAGENRVSFAMALADKVGTVGRLGIGAVLGSKKVKAVVVKGTKDVVVADRKRLDVVAKAMAATVKDSPYFVSFSTYNAHAGWGGYLTSLNPGEWSQDKWDECYGFDRYDEVRRKTKVCCAFRCKGGYKIQSGKWTGTQTDSGHFVVAAIAGQRLGLEDARDTIKLLDLCNREGLCFLTSACMTDWLTRLYAKGAIGKEQTGGMVLSRDIDSYLELYNSIIDARGFGQTVGRGWTATSEAIGIDANQDNIATGLAKGVDTLLDARFWTLSVSTFAYLVHPRPHHGHIHSPMYGGIVHELDTIKDDFRKTGVTEDEFTSVFTPVPYYGSFNVARYTRHIEDRGAVLQSLGVCDCYPIFSLLPIDRLAECFSAVTGIEMSARELKQAGERVCNLYKMVNVREGFSREDDQCPAAWYKAIDTPDGEAAMMDYYGTRKISPEDINNLLNDYYDERGWDIEQGIPGKEKLNQLKL
jgi:aldehyde:ferredoxin oxidoreductase